MNRIFTSSDAKLSIVRVALMVFSLGMILTFALSFRVVEYDVGFKVVASSIVIWLFLSAFDFRYIHYYTLLLISFVALTSEVTAMTPVDANKFYIEAFRGGYYNSDYLSTLVVTGKVFQFLSDFFWSKEPEVLVSVNYLLHCLTVIILLRTVKDKVTNKYIVFFLFLSPLVVYHLPYLLKDYFAIFFVVCAYGIFVSWVKRANNLKLVLFILFLLLSMLFRVYAPFYLLMFFVISGQFIKLHWITISLLYMLMFFFFGKETLFYSLYSMIAIYAVPNFFELNNYVETPIVLIEGLFLFLLQLMVIAYAIINKDKLELNRYFKIIALITLVYAFTSAFRVNFSSSYVPTGNIYLADNFFRKKIPIMYVLWLYISTSKFLKIKN